MHSSVTSTFICESYSHFKVVAKWPIYIQLKIVEKATAIIRKLSVTYDTAIMQAKLKYSVTNLPEQFFRCSLTFTPNFETILGDHFWSSSCPRSSKTGFFSKSLQPTLKNYSWLISATHIFLVTCRWLLSHHSLVEVQCCTQTVHSKLSDDGFLTSSKIAY